MEVIKTKEAENKVLTLFREQHDVALFLFHISTKNVIISLGS